MDELWKVPGRIHRIEADDDARTQRLRDVHCGFLQVCGPHGSTQAATMRRWVEIFNFKDKSTFPDHHVEDVEDPDAEDEDEDLEDATESKEERFEEEGEHSRAG